MTIADLIERLKLFPQDREVFLSKDAEGNRYSNVYGVFLCPSVDEDGELNVLADEDVRGYLEDGVNVNTVAVIYPY